MKKMTVQLILRMTSKIQKSLYLGQPKVRVKNTAEAISSLQSDISDADYTTDENTAILYNFNEGSGLTTVNEADSKEAGFQCNAGDCIASETWWVDLSTTLSSEEFNTISFKLFPNPTEDKTFVIQAKNNESLQSMEIFDVMGKTVKTLNFNNDMFYANVNVESLNAGIYIVVAKTDLGVGTQKLIIK